MVSGRKRQRELGDPLAFPSLGLCWGEVSCWHCENQWPTQPPAGLWFQDLSNTSITV